MAQESLHNSANLNWLDKPVLFYGARKAGTTLVLNLMDGGKMVVFPAEIKLKNLLHSPPVEEMLPRYLSLCTLRGYKYQNFDMEKYERLREEYARARSFSGDFLRYLIRSDILSLYQSTEKKGAEPTAWAMKEVGGKTTDLISRYRQLFPEGRVVMVVRNPLHIASSVFRNRRRRGIHMNLWQCFKQSRDPLMVLAAQGCFASDNRTLFVSYEDIVDDGKRTAVVTAICNFLDIPYSKSFEKPTVFGIPSVVRTASVKTTNVFQENRAWYEGLKWKERCLIYSFYTSVKIFLQVTGKYVSYKRIKEKCVIN